MSGRSRYRKKSPFLYPLNNFGSLFALILLFILIYVIFLVPLMDSMGGIGDFITDLVDIFPFGEVSFAFAIQIINAIAGQGVNYASIQGVFTFSYAMQELLEGIFTVILYEAGTRALKLAMRLDDPNVKGIWNAAKKMAVSVGVAILAACFAPALINYIFSNMGFMGNGWKTAIASIVTIILMGGGLVFFLFLYSLSFVSALLFTTIKFLLVGFLRLFGCYIFIFLFLLGIQNGMLSLILTGSGGLLMLTLMLAGIELMVDKSFHIN